MKECLKCREIKEYSQFSKKSASKDGYQPRCKSCNKIDNLHFRTEINPDHHAIWQKQNAKRAAELVSKYRKGDKTGIVYAMIAPDNMVYVGQTKTYLKVRLMEHKAKYNQYLKNNKSYHPSLHKSFDKYGFESHQVRILFEDNGIQRKDLKMIESAFIKSFKEINKSLNISD